MIVQFISAIALAILALLFCWAIFRTFKKPMPKHLYPIIAAASVIGYGIYSEYTWADRTIAQLPDSIKVVHELAGTSMFSPWSFVISRTDQLSMVDTASIRRNDKLPNYILTDLLLMQRFSPVIRVPQLIDCERQRRTDVTTNATYDNDGLPTNAKWENLDSGHAIVNVLCVSTES